MSLIKLKCPLGGGKAFQLFPQGAGIAFSLQGLVCVYSPHGLFLKIAAGKMGLTKNMG